MLRGRGLLLARAGWWLVAALSLAYFTADLPGRYPPLALHSDLFTFAPAPPDAVAAGLARLGLAPGAFVGYAVALRALWAAAFYLAGALLLWRRPAEPMALLVALFLVATPAGDADPRLLHALAAAHPLRAAIGMALETLAFALLLWLFLLFPDGRVRPRWAWPVGVGWLLAGASTILLPGSPLDVLTWPPALYAAFFLAALGAAVYAQVWRYRRVSGPVERQQAKWVALGLTLLLGTFAAGSVLDVVIPPGWAAAHPAPAVLADLVYLAVHYVAFLGLPVSLAVAILRHRLWDIDLIIRRTLVYGALTAALAALYFGGVALLTQLLRPLVGPNNQVAVVASTLAIAALAQPLRRRLQATIDRRFYRRKYDAEKTLAAFGATLRDETDLGRIEADLLGVVQETMQPAHASLWLREPERGRGPPNRPDGP